jgi:hypothetical protein
VAKSNESAREGSRAAEDVLKLIFDRADSVLDADEFWRGFLHTAHGAIALEMGELAFIAALKDSITVTPIAIATRRGELGRH